MVRAFFVALSILLVSASAQARDVSADIRSRVESISARLSGYEGHDHAEVARTEIGQARLEASDIQSKLAAFDYGGAGTVLSRLEARADLIDAQLECARMEALADERETTSNMMMQDADEKSAEYEAALARRQQLQDDVSIIVAQMNSETRR